MRTLIKNGTIVSASGSIKGDILMDHGKIEKIHQNLWDDQAEVVDAEGKLIFPGFIDTHTHLKLNNGVTDTADDFETGTRAAIAGGTTTVLDMATQNRGESLSQALENWHSLAKGRAYCDYGFHMSITDWNPAVAEEIPMMSRKGITSYKVYMAYDNLRISDGDIYDIIKAVGLQDGIVGCHCENGDMIKKLTQELLEEGMTGVSSHPKAHPAEIEAEAVDRFLMLGRFAGYPVYIVHTSGAMALERVREARKRGQIVYVESCPQYLLLDETLYAKANFEGAKYVMSPPPRNMADAEEMWRAYGSREIDFIGTDHCAFNFSGMKELGREDFSKIPNGIPGAQERPLVIYSAAVATGRISVFDMVATLSENPAKLFGMYPKKGAVLEGSDGDIVIWDTDYRGTLTVRDMKSACDYTPYEGMKLVGRPEQVYLRGEKVVDKGEIVGEKHGVYVKRGGCMWYR